MSAPHHPEPDALLQLHARWSCLSAHQLNRRSAALEFYRREVEHSNPTRRGQNWIRDCTMLEAWLVEAGEYPARPEDGAIERALYYWARNQRRNRLRLNTYQRERLGLLPEWRWEPQADAWFDRLHDYESFVREEGRRPKRRSGQRTERSLAIWWRNQRRRLSSNSMEELRRQLLIELDERCKQMLHP